VPAKAGITEPTAFEHPGSLVNSLFARMHHSALDSLAPAAITVGVCFIRMTKTPSAITRRSRRMKGRGRARRRPVSEQNCCLGRRSGTCPRATSIAALLARNVNTILPMKKWPRSSSAPAGAVATGSAQSASRRQVRRSQGHARRRVWSAPPDRLRDQAIQIAKQVPGTPIKMIWSREEDMLDLFCWGRIFG
jgi:hypothetical protein